MSAAPNPTNLILLGALGIGAYVFMSRRALAAPPGRFTAAVQPPPSPVASLLAAAARLFRPASPLLGTVDGRSAYQWDVSPTGPNGPMFNNPSAYTAGGVDGAAFNPVNQSPFDYTEDLGQYF